MHEITVYTSIHYTIHIATICIYLCGPSFVDTRLRHSTISRMRERAHTSSTTLIETRDKTLNPLLWSLDGPMRIFQQFWMVSPDWSKNFMKILKKLRFEISVIFKINFSNLQIEIFYGWTIYFRMSEMSQAFQWGVCHFSRQFTGKYMDPSWFLALKILVFFIIFSPYKLVALLSCWLKHFQRKAEKTKTWLGVV